MTMNANSIAPILYSFRRCPYAIRARMALAASAVAYVTREVSLQAKPAAMLGASPKGTVPVLVLPDGQVIDESLDIMRWALAQCDPDKWLSPGEAMVDLIVVNDGPFKFHLDRMKYANRYPGSDPALHRAEAINMLTLLEQRLCNHAYLFGSSPALADVAIFPFVRQFAHADASGFAGAPLPSLQLWLARWESSTLFQSVMSKHAVWQPNHEDSSS
jgi:glutathione S-transferase